MAGGKGKDYCLIHQFFQNTLQLDKPAIKHIIDKFNEYGQNKFFITVNYKSSLLASYFKSLKKSQRNKNIIRK